MNIIVKSHSTGLFNRHKVRVEKFSDDKGDYDDAMNHIALMIACENDIEIKVHTPIREFCDETLARIGSYPLLR